MLTPEMIQKFNQASGNNVPTQPGAEPSRADQILKIARESQPTVKEKISGAFNNDVLPGRILNTLTSSTQKLGTHLGSVLAAPAVNKSFKDATKMWADTGTQLLDAYTKAKEEGKDTTKIGQVLREHNDNPPTLDNFMSPEMQAELKKTVGQTVGEVAGTAVEALSGGLGGEGKAVATLGKPGTLLGKSINLGKDLAKGGAVVGAAQSGSNALAEGESAKDVVKSTLIGGATGFVGGKVLSGLGKGLSGVLSKGEAVGSAEKEISSIQEKIMPKPTAKEARIAQSEGRLVKGKEPTFFKSGTEDTVIPSDKVIQSSKTIQKNIPGAAKMDEPTLQTAIENKTEQIAKELEPQMKATKIKPVTIKKINKDWEKLKTSQIRNADATEETNVRKVQKQFEQRLMKTKSGNLNDLWKSAKEYDASIPENIKKANHLSSESLQNKKEIWLQNRAILREAITDSSSGMGKQSTKAFADMHDMYNAKENLMSKAKIETKVKPSKLKQAYESKPGKVLRTVGKVGLGYEAIKQATGL